MQRKYFNHKLARFAFVSIWLGVLGWLSIRLADKAILPMYDYLEYWSAGRLQLAGQNPYGIHDLQALQEAVGSPWDAPLIMWNPPWTLTFVMPLALLDFQLSRVVWFWISLTILFVSIEWSWQVYGGKSRHRWAPRLVGFTFLPALLALYLGQINLLILAGVVGFLHFERHGRWWLVGASTVLITVKPQLLFLFWPALLLWALDRRCWNVLLGGGLAGLLATAIPLIFNPSVLRYYLQTSTNHPPTYWMTPTIGTFLRMLAGNSQTWLQFVPPALGLVWFVFYWRHSRADWQWSQQLPFLMLVSLVTASHRWTHDQIVLLPALIQATTWISHSGQRLTAGLAAALYFGFNGLILAHITPAGDVWRVWTAPALLLSYITLHKQTVQPTHNRLPEHAEQVGVPAIG